MDIAVALLGRTGIVVVIGLAIFLFSFKYSVHIFDWVEKNTIGTRTYIMEKLELLFIEIKPEYITYSLLIISFVPAFLIVGILSILGYWWLGVIVGMIVSFVGFKIPKPVVDFLMERRIKAYQGQMVDALTLLSNGIRAGLSVPQAVGMIVDEMPSPISQEFNLILQQNKIGVTLEECFENLCKRVPTEDNDMFVSSINILRETGGNLAEVFDTIVGVIRERIRLQQKIDTYTASGMFQGMVIAMMPFGIGGVYFVTDPKSMEPLFTTPIGIIIMLVALGFDITGFLVILKIVKIKV